MSYSEGLSGSWVESLNSGFANPYIVLTDTRAYSAIARQYCRVASEKGGDGADHRYLVPVGAGLPD